MELDKIPGYKAALEKAAAHEEAARDLAFIEVPLEICGEAICQITLRHLLLLFTARSPFFYAGVAGPEHVAQFMWILSPAYRAGDHAARRAFNARVGRIVGFKKARREIEQYLDTVFLDRPGAGGVKAPAITSFVANFIDEFAAEYGWDDEAILTKPIARLYQYLRRIERRSNPKAIFFNSFTDKMRKQLVKAWLKTQSKKEPAK